MFQLSRLQHYEESYPTSATTNVENVGRKTWSAPNKDPFGLSEKHQQEMERKSRRTRTELDDPLKRKSANKSPNQEGYQPSFGMNNGRPVTNSRRYMKELEEQMADQKRRKEKEDKEKETDWWEKRKPLVAEFKVPHPNQVLLVIIDFRNKLHCLFMLCIKYYNLKLCHLNNMCI